METKKNGGGRKGNIIAFIEHLMREGQNSLDINAQMALNQEKKADGN